MRLRGKRRSADMAGGTSTSALERPTPLARRRPLSGADRPNPGVEVARLGVLLLVAVLLQTILAPNIRILGANPDFMVMVVASVGLLRGTEIGAFFGFAGGVLVAVALFEPVGIASFVLIIVGYLAGRYAETADLSSGFAPLVTVFVASIVAAVLFGMAQFLLGRQAPVWFVTTRVVLPLALLNTLLAAPVFILAKWWLRGEVRRVAEAD